MGRFRNLYKRLSIKWKLIIILSTIMFLLCVIFLFAISLVYRIYDRQVLSLSSQMLNLYTTSIENELRKVEQMTFTYFMDFMTQENLLEINYGESSYQRYQAIRNLRDKLLADSQSEIYISSISYFDIDGNEFTVGRSMRPFDAAHLTRILETVKNDGGIFWFEPTVTDYNLFAARQVRTTSDLKPLGYLVVRINPKQLILWVSGTWPISAGELMIYSPNGQEIYQDHQDKFDLDFHQLMNPSHTVKDKQGRNYLLTKVHSTYTDWVYFTLLSHEDIFQSVIYLRSTLIIAFLLLSILVLAVGIQFSSSITKPIIRLSKKMKFVETGEFERVSLIQHREEAGDEIAKLQNDFVIMVEKINALIRENYVKQLLIKESELKALQAQINPHFLYNTLDSICWEARVNKQERISTMVKALGGLLRRVISSHDHVTTIDEELQFLNDYMTIQKIRFEDRLDYVQQVDERLLNQKIVKMSLQPIVENSIKYALEKKSGVCRIFVHIHRVDCLIEIVVKDNGPGFDLRSLEHAKESSDSSKRTGIGLKNINERIKLTFGEPYGITIDSKKEEGTVVIMRIPYQQGDERDASSGDC